MASRYDYPNDGRGASSYPGVWADAMEWLWELEIPVVSRIAWALLPELNGPVDRAVSRHVLDHPQSPAVPVLEWLFGKRGSDE